jgi:hypothetical protein
VVDRFGVVVETGGPVDITVAQHAPVPFNGLLLYEEVNPVTHYVDMDTQQVVPKRTINATVNGTIISGIPFGATVRTEGQEILVTEEDGEIDLTYDIPGTYTVSIAAPTYNDLIVQVTA